MSCTTFLTCENLSPFMQRGKKKESHSHNKQNIKHQSTVKFE